MSVYNPKKNTTPFLASKKEEFLIADNNFSLSDTTFGSLSSLLLGKSPISTGLVYPGLQNPSTFSSFLDRLKDHGYNLILGTRLFSDPFLMQANFTWKQCDDLLEDFITRSIEWIGGLLASDYVTAIVSEMFDDMAGNTYFSSDLALSKWLLNRIDHSPQPFFSHIHLMATHCCDYGRGGANAISMSTGRGSETYEDAVRQVDRNIELLWQGLERRRLVDKSIIVVTSDHGAGLYRSPGSRLPLLIRFPKGKNSGHIERVTTLTDVDATVSDWLNWNSPPSTGESYSLLHPQEIPADRTILGLMATRRGPRLKQVVTFGLYALSCGTLRKYTFPQMVFVSEISIQGKSHSGPCIRRDRELLESARTMPLGMSAGRG